MIRFNCPECGATVKTEEDTGGLMAKCPSCKVKLRIPEPPPREPEPGPPVPKPKWWRTRRPRLTAARLSFLCAVLGYASLALRRPDWRLRILPFALAIIGIGFSIRALGKDARLYGAVLALLANLVLVGLAAFLWIYLLVPTL